MTIEGAVPIPPFRDQSDEDVPQIIKVFRIEAGEPDEDIRCLTESLSIRPGIKDEPGDSAEPENDRTSEGKVSNVQPKYTCLSYTWGKALQVRVIYVDNYPLEVTENLWKFLYTARRYRFQERLWADGICINQADITERNHQVRLMGIIYRNAHRVVVWLGLCDVDSQKLFQVSEILRKKAPTKEGSALSKVELATLINPQEERILFVGRRCYLLRGDRMMSGLKLTVHKWTREELEVCTTSTGIGRVLRRVMHSSYWSRAWVVQECLHAKQLSMLAPDAFIDLRAVMKWILTLPGGVLGSHHQRKLMYTLSEWQEFPLERHASLVSRMVQRDCLEPRDRIYATLSLLQNGHRFPIDYKHSPEQLFALAVKWAANLIRPAVDGKPDSVGQHSLARIAAETFLAVRLLPPQDPWALPDMSQILAQDIDRPDIVSDKVFWARADGSPGRMGGCASICVITQLESETTLLNWRVYVKLKHLDTATTSSKKKYELEPWGPAIWCLCGSRWKSRRGEYATALARARRKVTLVKCDEIDIASIARCKA